MGNEVKIEDRTDEGATRLSSVRVEADTTYEDFMIQLGEKASMTNNKVFVVDGTELNHATWTGPPHTVIVVSKDTETLGTNEASGTYEAKFQPHPATMTDTGANEYRAVHGLEPVAFALSEFIDNSLGATQNNAGERNIIISAHLAYGSKKENFIIVWDNGVGMDHKALEQWATYHKGKEYREGFVAPTYAKRRETYDHYLNGDISFFGIGGKQALFFIGDAVQIITKPRGPTNKDQRVFEMELDRTSLHDRHQQGKDVYKTEIKYRQPGKLFDDSNYGPYKEIFQKCEKEDSFCAVIIKLVHEDKARAIANVQPGLTHIHDPAGKASVVESSENSHPGYEYEYQRTSECWLETLAHVYHFYLEEPQNCGENKINIHAEVSKGGVSRKLQKRMLLRDKGSMQKSYDDASAHNQRGQVEKIKFLMDVTIPASKSNTMYKSSVHGFLRYHPTALGRETKPIAVDEKHNDKRVFWCFWNGRLIPDCRMQLPKALLDSITKPKKNGVPTSTLVDEGSYSRLSGCLFFTLPFEVTHNKMSFVHDISSIINALPIENYRQHGVHKSILKRGDTLWLGQWLNTMHKNYDKQLVFVGKPQPSLVYMGDDDTTSPNIELVFDRSSPQVHKGPVTEFTVYNGVKVHENEYVANETFLRCSKKGSMIEFYKVVGFLREGNFTTEITSGDELPNEANFRYLIERGGLFWPANQLWSRPLSELLPLASTTSKPKKGQREKEPEHWIRSLSQDEYEVELINLADTKYPHYITLEFPTGDDCDVRDDDLFKAGHRIGPMCVVLKTKGGKDVASALLNNKRCVVTFRRSIIKDGAVYFDESNPECWSHEQVHTKDPTSMSTSASSSSSANAKANANTKETTIEAKPHLHMAGFWFQAFDSCVVGDYELSVIARQPNSLEPWCEKKIRYSVITDFPDMMQLVYPQQMAIMSCDQPLKIGIVITDEHGNEHDQNNKDEGNWTASISGGNYNWMLKNVPAEEKKKVDWVKLTTKRDDHNGRERLVFELTTSMNKFTDPTPPTQANPKHFDGSPIKISVKLKYTSKTEADADEKPRTFEDVINVDVQLSAGAPKKLLFNDPEFRGIEMVEGGDLTLPGIQVVDKLGYLCAPPKELKGLWQFKMLLRKKKTNTDKKLLDFQCSLDRYPIPAVVTILMNKKHVDGDLVLRLGTFKNAPYKELELKSRFKVIQSRELTSVKLVQDGAIVPFATGVVGQEASNLSLLLLDKGKNTVPLELAKKTIVGVKYGTQTLLVADKPSMLTSSELGTTISLPNIPGLPKKASKVKSSVVLLWTSVKQATTAAAPSKFSVDLHVQTRSDKPHKLIVSFSKTAAFAMQGEPTELSFKQYDQYNNPCNAEGVDDDLPTIECDGFRGDTMEISRNQHLLELNVSNIVFTGKSRMLELKATWCSLETKLEFLLKPGMPHTLKLVSTHEESEGGHDFTVINRCPLQSDLAFQVIDSCGNNCSFDNDDCRVGLKAPKGLVIVDTTASKNTRQSAWTSSMTIFESVDNNGLVKFDEDRIAAALAPSTRTSAPKFGEALWLESVVMSKSIRNNAAMSIPMTPTVTIAIQKDMQYPAGLRFCEMDDETCAPYMGPMVVQAGEIILPLKICCVNSDGGVIDSGSAVSNIDVIVVTIVNTLNPNHRGGKKKCKAIDTESPRWLWQDMKAPSTAATTFSVRATTTVESGVAIQSEDVKLHVRPRPVFKMESEFDNGTVLSTDSNERSFPSALILKLFDQYDNVVTDGPLSNNLRVNLSVTADDNEHTDDTNVDVPTFQTLSNNRFTDGVMKADSLTLKKASNGTNGGYIININAELVNEDEEAMTLLENCKLPKIKFHFTNNEETRRLMKELVKKKTDMSVTLREKRAQVSKVKTQSNMATQKRNDIIESLHITREQADASLEQVFGHKQRAPSLLPLDVDRINSIIQEVEKDMKSVRSVRSPRFGDTNIAQSQGVHGYVGDLIRVADDDVCLQMCWHLLGQGKKCKVLVCDDIQTANKWKRETEVLALSTARTTSDKWPRVCNVTMQQCGGNYFGNMVEFHPKNKDAATRAFNALIGDKMFFPTLAHANNYRRQNRKAGLIVNLDGSKVESSGVFGGRVRKPVFPGLQCSFDVSFETHVQHKALIKQLQALKSQFQDLLDLQVEVEELKKQSQDQRIEQTHRDIEILQHSFDSVQSQLNQITPSKQHPSSSASSSSNKRGRPARHDIPTDPRLRHTRARASTSPSIHPTSPYQPDQHHRHQQHQQQQQQHQQQQQQHQRRGKRTLQQPNQPYAHGGGDPRDTNNTTKRARQAPH